MLTRHWCPVVLEMVLSECTVLCGQPVGMNTPWCVITATDSVRKTDCPHTSYPASQTRTVEYQFLDGRIVCDTNSGPDSHSVQGLALEPRAPRAKWHRNHPWVRQAIVGHHLQMKTVALRW